MAHNHNVEPMDIDNIDSDFDNKENSVHHNNVYPRTPCTEKGYEELDVSELNMKLRYSITPISTPMSKSYTANSLDNKHQESDDNIINANLTRSFNAAISKNDVMNKSVKSLPLQSMNTDQLADSNRNISVLRPLDTTAVIHTGNTTITVTDPNDIDENLSIPSSLSSNAHTPKVTTPTKGMAPSDGGSPIMRGLKSVLNMFRSSQSPIPPEGEVHEGTQILSPLESTNDGTLHTSQAILASTPIAAHRDKESNISKRNSPLKESIVFNEDLEKELLWKDETTILFSEEKIPIHKLFFQQPLPNITGTTKLNEKENPDNLNSTVEYMDISYNSTSIQNKTITNIKSEVESSFVDSESEFLDCETTFNENNHNLGKKTLENENITNVSEDNTKNIECLPIDLLVEHNEKPSYCQNLDLPEPESTSLRMLHSNETESEVASNLEVIVNDEKHTGVVDVSTNLNANNVQDQMLLSQIINEVNIVEPVNIVEENLHSEVQKCYQLQLNIASGSENKYVLDDINISSENALTTLSSELSNEIVNSKANNLLTEDNIKKKCAEMDIQDSPANIPLPDEDETESNSDATSNVTSEAKLESIIHIVNLPIEITGEAKSVNIHKSIIDSITPELDVHGIQFVENINGQEPNSTQITGTNINLENKEERGEDLELRQSILTDIDNIINDAKASVNLQQNDLIETTGNLDALEAGVFETNEVCEMNHHDMVTNILSVECTNLNLVTENTYVTDFEKQSTEKILNFGAINETESKPDVNQFNMSIDIEIIPNSEMVFESIEHTLTGTVDNSVVNYNTHKIQDVTDPNFEFKVETLPDLIPDTSCDVLIKSVDDNTFNKKPIIQETNNKITEESTNEQQILNKDQIKNNVEEEVSNIIQETNNKITEESTNEQQILNKDEIKNNIEEEVILSESNSPYVSIDGKIEQIPEHIVIFDNNVNPFVTKTNDAISPPVSPKIISKGYNFDFDEIDDPFATKTKIRMSPPLDSQTSITPKVEKASKVVNNRRKSQPEQRKSTHSKNNINATFSGSVNVQEETPIKKLDSNRLENCSDINAIQKVSHSSKNKVDIVIPPSDVNVAKTLQCESTDPILKAEIESQSALADNEGQMNYKEAKHSNANKHENIEAKIETEQLDKDIDTVCMEDSKLSIESLPTSNEIRNTSSSEQSTYYSAATSSGEHAVSRNVFSIPEIDDFNPFITKSKMRLTPPPGKEIESSSQTDKSLQEDFNIIAEVKSFEIFEDKECVNSSNTTCSSKTTDEKDITVQEVFTEDEDTVEGPFLETEDVNADDKISDFDGNDLMMFSKLPKQVNEDNSDGGELFIDAEAFEFLLNQNQSNAVADSAKESLFLKFDPLFAKRVSTDGVLSVLKKVQKRQSTPKKTLASQQLNTTFDKSITGPSNINMTQEMTINVSAEESIDDINVTVTKPMMVVTPAVNPIVTPRNKSSTPTSSNRRSITFTSPAIAVIDRLLSMSGNNSMLGDTTVAQINREQNEAELALTQLRELLADKEIHVYNLRSETKELKDRLSNLESQMRTLGSESEKRLKKVNELNEKLCEKTKLNKSMAAVVEEYERTIASLIAETEQDKKRNNEERIKLIQERDEQTAHLASMEVSFSDLHSKYEKSKQIILTCKANEDAYKKSIKVFEDNVSKMQSNYELLKQHATSKLNHANQELEKINRTHEAEVLKLNAMIKRKDLHITSLEETLAQKTKANEELAAICDELINKVG